MSRTSPTPVAQERIPSWIKGMAILLLLLGSAGLFLTIWTPHPLLTEDSLPPPSSLSSAEAAAVHAINEALHEVWENEGIEPAPPAPSPLVLRRLGLALTGTIPSVEELRALEQLPEDQQIDAWMNRLFQDPRSSHYLAERFARVFVGTEFGPFLVYRRRRMKTWLAEQFQANRPYHDLARDLIQAEGIWTSNPETNFLTYTLTDGPGKKRPDEIKLASRTSRAFLGIRLDCMQCHDDKLHDTWKQTDFHHLAAFYGSTTIGASGIRDGDRDAYAYRLHGDMEAAPITAQVPYAPQLMPSEGALRQRLAAWTTHPENEAFARTSVNRAWALLFGKPLVEPIDDIPLQGPWPEPMTLLADTFTKQGGDLRSLLRIIAHTAAFQRHSRSADPSLPLTETQENTWAAFPLTPLRPEQVAQSVIQVSSLRTIDPTTHVIQRLRRFGSTNDFIKRFGDPGENEFEERSSTIPQRLLLMNGELVREQLEDNMLLNAPPRLHALTKDPTSIVQMAYLGVLSRMPTSPELTHFQETLSATKRKARLRAIEDLYWSLINSTEFSWNH